jgi:hypothetical protein
MVSDLRYRVGLVGRSKAEVINMLGKPEEQQDDLPTDYELCPSLADTYILELAWKQGRVASVIVRDT